MSDGQTIYPDMMTPEHCADALSDGNATATEQKAAARHMREMMDRLAADDDVEEISAERYAELLSEQAGEPLPSVKVVSGPPTSLTYTWGVKPVAE